MTAGAAEQTLRAVIGWGRYAEAFAYDDRPDVQPGEPLVAPAGSAAGPGRKPWRGLELGRRIPNPTLPPAGSSRYRLHRFMAWPVRISRTTAGAVPVRQAQKSVSRNPMLDGLLCPK